MDLDLVDIKGFLFLGEILLRLGSGILVTKKPARGRLVGAAKNRRGGRGPGHGLLLLVREDINQLAS